MASVKRKIFGKVISNDFFWALLKRPVDMSAHIRHYREQVVRKREIEPILEKASKIFSDLTVKNGPFKGLKYPQFLATGSSIFPKLLGSYEKELHPLLDEIIKKDYSEILNIGCAEGYYAVGLAMKMPGVIVHAYDTDKIAQNATTSMAELNKVSDRIKVESTCTPEILKNF